MILVGISLMFSCENTVMMRHNYDVSTALKYSHYSHRAIALMDAKLKHINIIIVKIIILLWYSDNFLMYTSAKIFNYIEPKWTYDIIPIKLYLVKFWLTEYFNVYMSYTTILKYKLRWNNQNTQMIRHAFFSRSPPPSYMIEM